MTVHIPAQLYQLREEAAGIVEQPTVHGDEKVVSHYQLPFPGAIRRLQKRRSPIPCGQYSALDQEER
jgi:hypothetical protein